MLIDTHAHVNFQAFKDDAEAVISRAFESGVSIINVGTQIDTSRQAVELAEKYKEDVYAVIGLHPVHTYSQHLDEEETSFQSREESFDYNAYHQLAQNLKVVGVGECGLDYYRLPEGVNSKHYTVDSIKYSQKNAFIQQIKLARELNKALVIHCRPSAGTQDAYEDILKILDAEFLHPSFNPSPSEGREGVGGSFEIHSFTGSPEIAQEFLKRGAYVGLNGIITFDRTGNMKKVVDIVPLEKIVLETDSPYLTPVPHRGKRNEPSFVKFVAEKVAEIKNINIAEVENQTIKNAKSLFLI